MEGMMDPWVTVVLFGVAIFGFAWLTPAGRNQEDRARGSSDPAYDQLLEELETENRELLDAVTQFKQDQDETVKNLVKQLQELERQMHVMTTERQAAAAAAAAANEQRTIAVPIAPPEEASSVTAPAPSKPRMEAPVPDQPAPPATAITAPIPIRERYAELLAQHRKGKSIEQIAKSAGMNKGEVQLILQLARREEEQLA